MALQLTSKAETLENLADVIQTAKVLPMIRFSVREYSSDAKSIIDDCVKIFDAQVIVRSSSHNEDNANNSNAGGYLSIAYVDLTDIALGKAIETVIESYGKTCSLDDEVFIQPMLQDVTVSGVAFTADIDTLAPYYVINYDESGSTHSVTGGVGQRLKTFVSLKEKTDKDPQPLHQIILTCKECERIFDNKFLDIEFAIANDVLYLLQVRAIVTHRKKNLNNIDLFQGLQKLRKRIGMLNQRHPNLLGSKTMFGVMPDWNPAEIIGLRPKKLALSLYKELVTDEIWAYQRDNYGYRKLRSFPLLHSFMGVPFVDVRVSFNSFIPKKLHENIASKLVEYYLEALSLNREQHDKVEFEIVFSCYFFGIDKKLKCLQKKGFSDNEIKRIEFELLQLTNNVIDVEEGLYKKDLKKIDRLHEKYKIITESNLAIVDKIYWLIEDCKRYGTLPFAGIARAAFIAVQFLNSFVDEGIISSKERSLFLSSLSTVSKVITKDVACMNKETFLQKYGHLRPGTYDITSNRYDENYEQYFCDCKSECKEEFFEFSSKQLKCINHLIIENGLQTDADKLILFMREAIEGREYAKYQFSRHLSKILQLIEELGIKVSLSRAELSHLDIQVIQELYTGMDHRDIKSIFLENIEKNRSHYEYTLAVKFPNLIVDEEDIFKFYTQMEEPTFITLKSVTAEVVELNEKYKESLTDKIICIESADPGFDYLFSHGISGLITCYGGANSHMAIRCAEIGIPAVIGCGENMFGKYLQAKVLTVDAGNRQVKIIS